MTSFKTFMHPELRYIFESEPPQKLNFLEWTHTHDNKLKPSFFLYFGSITPTSKRIGLIVQNIEFKVERSEGLRRTSATITVGEINPNGDIRVFESPITLVNLTDPLLYQMLQVLQIELMSAQPSPNGEGKYDRVVFRL